MDLDGYIRQRYGVVIDQIEEMDADLADVIRWGVLCSLGKRQKGRPYQGADLTSVGLDFSTYGHSVWLHGMKYRRPRQRKMGCARLIEPTLEEAFGHLSHLIERDEAAE